MGTEMSNIIEKCVGIRGARAKEKLALVSNNIRKDQTLTTSGTTIRFGIKKHRLGSGPQR